MRPLLNYSQLEICAK